MKIRIWFIMKKERKLCFSWIFTCQIGQWSACHFAELFSCKMNWWGLTVLINTIMYCYLVSTKPTQPFLPAGPLPIVICTPSLSCTSTYSAQGCLIVGSGNFHSKDRKLLLWCWCAWHDNEIVKSWENFTVKKKKQPKISWMKKMRIGNWAGFFKLHQKS